MNDAVSKSEDFDTASAFIVLVTAMLLFRDAPCAAINFAISAPWKAGFNPAHR